MCSQTKNSCAKAFFWQSVKEQKFKAKKIEGGGGGGGLKASRVNKSENRITTYSESIVKILLR